MITIPLIVTWAVGGAVGATAGFWATHVWRKVTKEQKAMAARLDDHEQLLKGEQL